MAWSARWRRCRWEEGPKHLRAAGCGLAAGGQRAGVMPRSGGMGMCPQVFVCTLTMLATSPLFRNVALHKKALGMLLVDEASQVPPD